MVENQIIDNENAAAAEIWFYPDRLRKLLDFTGTSYSALARKSGVPDGTVRKLLQGETKDPRVSTLGPILRASGADANIVMGLSPARDYNKELNREGVMLAEVLQKRVEESDKELARIRRLALEKAERMAAAEGRVSSLEFMVGKRDETIRQQAETIAQYECRLEAKRNRIEELTSQVSKHSTTVEAIDGQLSAVRASRDRRNKTCKRLLVALCMTICIMIAVSVYCIWEVTNITKGQTGRQLDAYLQHLEEMEEIVAE